MKQRVPHPRSLCIGLTLVACGLALGAASIVTVANALCDMVR